MEKTHKSLHACFSSQKICIFLFAECMRVDLKVCDLVYLLIKLMS